MTSSNSPSRLLPFRSVHNFRDLGGYPTQDGRTVRYGSLYRSGHLGKLSRRDQRRLAALHIDTIVDLRSVAERERRPNKLPHDLVRRYLELPILDEANAAMEREVRQRIDARDFSDFDALTLMSHAYAQFVTDFSAEFRALILAVLEAEDRPILWHCTAGKDRTGFGAAVLLSLLGVDRETVMQDYLLSAQHVDQHRGLLLLLRVMRGRKAVNHVKPFMTVHASWLQTALDEIDEGYGSMENYARDALQLSQGDIDQLRDFRLA